MTSRVLACAALLACVAWSAGCRAQPTGAPAEPARQIVSLRVLSSPAPVVIGEGTQPNGIWAQVYALAPGQSRGVVLPAGRLELLLFDGAVRSRDVSEAEPHLRITHRSEQIARSASATIAGVRYALPVRWDDDPPESGIATLVVRFVPDEGPAVHSSAVSVRLGPT